MYARFIFLSLVFVLGLSMLSGITSNVVSETCCVGEECSVENRCVLQEPMQVNDWLGVSIVMLSIVIAIGEIYMLRKRIRR